MKQKNRIFQRGIVGLCVLGFLFIGGLLLVLSPLFQVQQKTSEIHLEVGTKPSQEPSVYLEGDNFAVELSMVDTSKVKETKVGRYPIYIYHGFDKYTTYVNVTDTTAPVIKSDIKNMTIKPGEVLSISSLGLDIKDYSEVESVLFTEISSTKFYTGLPEEETVEMRELYRKGIALEAEEFLFSYGGIYTITISATDSFHNTSTTTLTLKVEQPPVLDVPENFYVADVVELDFADYIEVWDFISEDLGAQDVEVDTSQLELSKKGTYEITFTATDEYGLSTSKTAVVHVSSQEDLQEAINTHTVDVGKDIVIGAINAYDSGYYASENIEFIQNIMLPCIVNIENDVLDTFGSGFILEITEDFVTIATNEHVINGDLTVDVSFFDAAICSGAVVASNPQRDVAFIRIPIEGKNSNTSLTKDYVQKLRTVHIDKGYWDELSDDCGIVIGYNCINNEGKIWTTQTGEILEKVAIRDWNQYKDVKETIISMEPISGTSGSAIFDGYGRLVGMVRGYTEYEGYTETVAVPLDELLQYFETVFKYKIHYQ